MIPGLGFGVDLRETAEDRIGEVSSAQREGPCTRESVRSSLCLMGA